MKRFLHVCMVCAVCVAVAGALTPAQAPDARAELIDYLNGLARGHLALRAKTIAAVRTAAEATRRQADVKKKLLGLIGGLPGKPATQGVRSYSRSPQNGFTLESLAYESLPGFWVTANVYVPAGSGPFPAVVLVPGHGVGGKTELWSWGANFARNGVLALAYDPLGQGERLQYFSAIKNASEVGNPTGEHGEANVPPLLIGETVARYMVNDAVRSIDYLLGRGDVDARRIGAFGCSGGGVTTAYLAALDDRVQVAASACYISSFNKLLTSATGVQEAEQSLPGFLAAGLDFADWVEVVAPRPYAIVSTTDDMFPFAGAKETFDEASRFYGLFGASDDLRWITGPGGHGNLGPISSEILNFFLTHLHDAGPPPRPTTFVPASLDDPNLIRSTPTGQVATSFQGETVASLNARRSTSLMPLPLTAETTVLVERLRRRLQTDIPALTGAVVTPGGPAPRVDVLASDARATARVESLAMQTDGGGPVNGALVVPAVLAAGTPPTVARPGRAPVTLLFSDRPIAEALAADGIVDRLARSGSIVLILNPRPTPVGTESIKSPYLGAFNLLALRAFLVNKTLVGLRIDDTIRAINWLARRSDVDITALTVTGKGPLAMVVLHAAVLDDRIRHLDLEDLLVSYRSIVDQPLHQNVSEVVVPGVLRHYDVSDLLTVLRSKDIRLVTPRDAGGAMTRR